MNRIDRKFSELKEKGKKAFIVYITAGDPDIATTKKLVSEFESRGVDIVEIGIPFSDPIADGLTIQAASYRALKRGISVKEILKSVSQIRRTVELPICFMTYYNPVLAYGPEKFIKDAKSAGADGIIVPDLPYEESQELSEICKKELFSLILLAAPTSTEHRIREIAKLSTGFIYYVSTTGVTGSGASVASDIAHKVKEIKKVSAKPVCVGFGVSSPEQAKAIARTADGVIVGSAVIKNIEKNSGKKDAVSQAGSFVASFSKAIKE